MIKPRECFHCGCPKDEHQEKTLRCPDGISELWGRSRWYSTEKELYFVVLIGISNPGQPLPLLMSDTDPNLAWAEDALALYPSEESAMRVAKEMFPYLEAEVYPWRHHK